MDSSRSQYIDNSIMEFVLENITNGLPSTKETVQRKALKVTTFLKVLRQDFKTSDGWAVK